MSATKDKADKVIVRTKSLSLELVKLQVFTVLMSDICIFCSSCLSVCVQCPGSMTVGLITIMLC